MDANYGFIIPEKDDTPISASYWGTVLDDHSVALDADMGIVPADASSLVATYPGQRVTVDQYGKGLRISGELKSPVIFPAGDNADLYISPAEYSVRKGSEATLANGFPKNGGSGWLEVLGDADMILQRFTYFSSPMEVWQRSRTSAGVWSAWRQIDNVPTPPPTPAPFQTPVLLNGWAEYVGFGTPRFKVEDGMVYLFGTVRYGTPGPNTPIWIMPPEATPSGTRFITGADRAVMHDLRITKDGKFYVYDPNATFGYITFEGRFYSL